MLAVILWTVKPATIEEDVPDLLDAIA